VHDRSVPETPPDAAAGTPDTPPDATARIPAIAYEPELVPPLERMELEGIDVLEEWFRWGEEWSVLLRVFGRMASDADVLEIGCGQGRVAFPLRFALFRGGTYTGFDIDRDKIAFLQRFHEAYPAFRFEHADVHNTFYNRSGTIAPERFRFRYPARSFDLVIAASIFTHMRPAAVARYMTESARVLRPGGRCVFSFFLLDLYDPARPRPLGFADPRFAFDHRHPGWGPDVGVAEPASPEQMTAYRIRLVRRMARDAGLRIDGRPIQGIWSGAARAPVGAQDLVVLHKPRTTAAPRAAIGAARRSAKRARRIPAKVRRRVAAWR
jgi:SAM-dependent methyltransferase